MSNVKVSRRTCYVSVSDGRSSWQGANVPNFKRGVWRACGLTTSFSCSCLVYSSPRPVGRRPEG
eukprot:6063779-Pyramimonas_sp.AAC.1